MKLLRELNEARYNRSPIDHIPPPTPKDMRKYAKRGTRQMYSRDNVSDKVQNYLDRQWSEFKDLTAKYMKGEATADEVAQINGYMDVIGKYLKAHGVEPQHFKVDVSRRWFNEPEHRLN